MNQGRGKGIFKPHPSQELFKITTHKVRLGGGAAFRACAPSGT